MLNFEYYVIFKIQRSNFDTLQQKERDSVQEKLGVPGFGPENGPGSGQCPGPGSGPGLGLVPGQGFGHRHVSDRVVAHSPGCGLVSDPGHGPSGGPGLGPGSGSVLGSGCA